MAHIAPPYRIVIALDDSEYAEVVLEHGLDQAARREAVDLHLITVVAREADVDAAKERMTTMALELLDAFRVGAARWRTRLHARVGRPADEVVDLADEIDAHLIVTGRFGAPRALETVLARASCPVLTIGLSGSAPEAHPQCPDCVRLREESDGTRWFCAAHAAPGRVRLTTLLPPSIYLTGSGPLW